MIVRKLFFILQCLKYFNELFFVSCNSKETINSNVIIFIMTYFNFVLNAIIKIQIYRIYQMKKFSNAINTINVVITTLIRDLIS